MYLILESDYTEDIESNTWDDFMVNLPRSYYFPRSEMWEVGMVAVYLRLNTKTQHTQLQDNIRSRSLLPVCCNIIESTVLNNEEQNVIGTLRLIDICENIYNPGHVMYVPLVTERLSSVHVYIILDSGRMPSLHHATTTVVLHIKKAGS